MFTFLSALATLEKERIATRIREVKQINKSKEKITGGKAKFGYEVKDGVRLAKPNDQMFISQMKRLQV
ncbi:MAG: putative DNA-invertase from lambdoid prophage Rac [Methylophilaceae bacterium]